MPNRGFEFNSKPSRQGGTGASAPQKRLERVFGLLERIATLSHFKAGRVGQPALFLHALREPIFMDTRSGPALLLRFRNLGVVLLAAASVVAATVFVTVAWLNSNRGRAANGPPHLSLQLLNVRDFGAKGDGTTDESAAIRSAIAYASKHEVYTLYFPAGRYLFSEAITVRSGVGIVGDGIDVTTLRYSGLGSAIALHGNRHNQLVKNSLRRFSLYGVGTEESTGISLLYASYSKFEDLRVFGFAIGLSMSHSWLNTLLDVTSESCTQRGFSIEDEANSNALIHCTAVNNKGTGFFIEGPRGLMLTDCNAEMNTINIHISARQDRATEKISIVGGYYEGAASVGVMVSAQELGPPPKAITIRDAYFVALVPGTTAIRAAACETLLVEGCHFSKIGMKFDRSIHAESSQAQIIWGLGNLDESNGGAKL